jgi:hypothetical protein
MSGIAEKANEDVRKTNSCVFLTTPTSGTASLWRIISHICDGILTPENETEGENPLLSLSNENLAYWHPEPHKKLYMYRRSSIVNKNLLDKSLRLIVNVRDPRDLACHHFHWVFEHPRHGTEAEIADYRANVAKNGIDHFVLNWHHELQYRAHIALAERLLNKDHNVVCVSYNQLCLGFDKMIGKLVSFFQVETSKFDASPLDLERVNNLPNNPLWIGQQWSGTDVSPGRYKSELKKETIEIINVKYKETLSFLKKIEDPEFSNLYDF